MTILFFVCLGFYLVILWFGVINSNEGTNPIALLIISTIVFGAMITITSFLIIKLCYGYWILLDDSIIYKKLFSKRRKVKLSEIERVEKKIVSALVLGIYKSEAYIISSSDNKIIILIRERKKFSELDYELSKFINKNGE
jgi:hypothetical protein